MKDMEATSVMRPHTTNPNADKGPSFYLVYETAPSEWNSVAYWNVGVANKRAAEIRATGRFAFVEMR